MTDSFLHDRPGRWDRVRAAAIEWSDRFVAEERRFDLVASMTLVLLIFFVNAIWYMQIGVLSLSVLAVLYRPLMRSALFWFAITFVLAVGHYATWFSIDNHKYLITYWCFALALARLADDPERFTAFNARVLIGLAFSFAVLWKLISVDYLNGAFFESILVQDMRFYGVTEVLGGASAAGLKANIQRLIDLKNFADPGVGVAMNTGGGVPLLAQLMTWWTIGIEALVAVCFLWPKDRGPSRWRDPALLAFLLTTYLVAPVVGFAWVLTAMATAQCSTRPFRYWPVLYTAAFIVALASLYFPFARVQGLLF